MERLTPRDATMYWLAEKIPNDQFLLYAFDTSETDAKVLQEWVVHRARAVPDLRLVIRDVPWNVDYPVWVPRDVDEDRIVVHRLPDRTWQGCRDVISEVLGSTVDVHTSPWRLHLFPGVSGAPNGTTAPSLIAVLQVSHALADGRRAAAIARSLFGPAAGPNFVDDRSVSESREPSGPELVVRGLLRTPVLIGAMIAASVGAFRAYRESEALTEQGRLPPKRGGRELTALNSNPNGRHGIRLIVLPLSHLRGGSETVTVAALTAVSVALARYLERGGEAVPESLGAEVTVADSGVDRSRNRFRNVSVDLFPYENDLRVRARRIALALDERRARARHRTVEEQGRAGEVTPAPMIRGGVRSFSPEQIPDTVAGNTVLTSVNRGPADLRFAGGVATFTAGFPALSPVMGVTHGVYSLGDTVTVGVHFGPNVMSDPDAYEESLRGALDEVRAALR